MTGKSPDFGISSLTVDFGHVDDRPQFRQAFELKYVRLNDTRKTGIKSKGRISKTAKGVARQENSKFPA